MANKVDSSGLSVISEERTSARKHNDSDEYESISSSHKAKSVYGGGHKKKIHPLMLGPGRQNPGKIISLHTASKNNLSEFTQRIMSAKLIRTKQVQNQLNETQNQLNELINENRILRNMLKRQEGALKKYEGNHAELPQLIRSHNEEIRALKANNKIIKAQLRESNTKLKDRETELEALRENYNKLKKLSTEKNLLEREKLHKKVEDLQEIIKEQEEKIQVLSRKVLLESKNYRHHLNVEVMKHKETQKDLTSALSMINKLERELVSKDKQLPGGKVLPKRESKNLMPAIINKSVDMQPKIGGSEDSFLSRASDRRKSLMSDSTEPELELLNSLDSSGDTPSPFQDIFPEINALKKPNPEMKTTTEITYSKSEMFQESATRATTTLRSRKNSMSKKNKRIPKDPTLNAKAIAESLSEDIQAIDNLAEKVQSTTLGLENRDEINSLFEEINSTKASKYDVSAELLKRKQEKEEDNLSPDNPKQRKQESRRNVSKRKLEEEEEETDQFGDAHLDLEIQSELSKTQQQKLENMTKTWNSLKSKIQEERKKAEAKMKELQKLNDEHSPNDSSSEQEAEKIENSTPESEAKIEETKELSFVNFTDDSYILEELEKTDKIFNKLKNEAKKSAQKTSSSTTSSGEKKSKSNTAQKSTPKQHSDIKNFRTESHREPKYLEEFQKEYQKQNLLKALKAIDVGKNGNISTEESENSEPETTKGKPFKQKNGLKHVKQLSSESNKGLMAELFGPKHKSENFKLEYGTVNE